MQTGCDWKDEKLKENPGVISGKFLCVGMGETNVSVAAAIKLNGGEVIGVDDSPTPELKKYLLEGGMEFYSAPSSEKLMELYISCDYCIPTPGLADSHPIYSFEEHLSEKKQRERGAKIISELDYAASLTDKPFIGITGTNGKSTVVEMVCACLQEAGIKSVTAGNTDVPFSRAVLENPDSEIFVVEASSFQLRNSRYFAPSIAVWLNFAPNHLDMHSSLKAYEKSKAKIWAHLSVEDLWVANKSDSVVWKNRPKKLKGKSFGEQSPSSKSGASAANLNIEAICIIAEAAGADQKSIENGIRNFKNLPHRMELVAEENEIKWINDSKATTPHAVLAGLSSLQKTVLILGGRDKSGNFAELKEKKNIRAVVAIGESASSLLEIFKGACPVAAAHTMKEAVIFAGSFAKQGDTVLFSPGGSSFDWYNSYKERGEDFKKVLAEFFLIKNGGADE